MVLSLDLESNNNSIIIIKIFSPFLLQSNWIELILEFLLYELSKYANSIIIIKIFSPFLLQSNLIELILEFLL